MKTLTFTDKTSIRITDESDMHSIYVKARSRREILELFEMFNEANLLHTSIDDGIDVTEYDYYQLDGFSVNASTLMCSFHLSPPLTTREAELQAELTRLKGKLDEMKKGGGK